MDPVDGRSLSPSVSHLLYLQTSPELAAIWKPKFTLEDVGVCNNLIKSPALHHVHAFRLMNRLGLPNVVAALKDVLTH